MSSSASHRVLVLVARIRTVRFLSSRGCAEGSNAGILISVVLLFPHFDAYTFRFLGAGAIAANASMGSATR